MAPLSNAQRQALHRERLKALKQSAVTPDDVRRAVRLMYDWQGRQYADPAWLPFDEWVASLRGKRRGANTWLEYAPDDVDPSGYGDDYDSGFSPEDQALLLKVAAVVRAVKYPPD